MSKHKSEDYKIYPVEYYLYHNKTQEEVCNIFKCSVRSLMFPQRLTKVCFVHH